MSSPNLDFVAMENARLNPPAYNPAKNEGVYTPVQQRVAALASTPVAAPTKEAKPKSVAFRIFAAIATAASVASLAAYYNNSYAVAVVAVAGGQPVVAGIAVVSAVFAFVIGTAQAYKARQANQKAQQEANLAVEQRKAKIQNAVSELDANVTAKSAQFIKDMSAEEKVAQKTAAAAAEARRLQAEQARVQSQSAKAEETSYVSDFVYGIVNFVSNI